MADEQQMNSFRQKTQSVNEMGWVRGHETDVETEAYYIDYSMGGVSGLGQYKNGPALMGE